MGRGEPKEIGFPWGERKKSDKGQAYTTLLDSARVEPEPKEILGFLWESRKKASLL